MGAVDLPVVGIGGSAGLRPDRSRRAPASLGPRRPGGRGLRGRRVGAALKPQLLSGSVRLRVGILRCRSLEDPDASGRGMLRARRATLAGTKRDGPPSRRPQSTSRSAGAIVVDGAITRARGRKILVGAENAVAQAGLVFPYPARGRWVDLLVSPPPNPEKKVVVWFSNRPPAFGFPPGFLTLRTHSTTQHLLLCMLTLCNRLVA